MYESPCPVRYHQRPRAPTDLLAGHGFKQEVNKILIKDYVVIYDVPMHAVKRQIALHSLH